MYCFSGGKSLNSKTNLYFIMARHKTSALYYFGIEKFGVPWSVKLIFVISSDTARSKLKTSYLLIYSTIINNCHRLFSNYVVLYTEVI